MQNWSRQQQWQPAEVCYPTSEEEVVGIVQRAATERKKIRTIGSGHLGITYKNWYWRTILFWP
jgi:FAD/FMN-containing dehydrogenase